MQPLRQFDSFKFEAVNDNDKFKIEMRKIESKMKAILRLFKMISKLEKTQRNEQQHKDKH